MESYEIMLCVFVEINFYVFVHTSNIDDGGTQAKVYITLHGVDDSKEHNLQNSSFDSFAQNQ
jgi:hypothetical protein